MTRRSVTASGLTLIEVLVSVGIVALLTAILLPAMSAGRHAAKDLECRANFREVSQRFTHFADESGVGLRGDSQRLGPELFLLEDFQESIYGLHEFWEGPEATRQLIDASLQPLMCPESPTKLERRSGIPCSEGAVGPASGISAGFNKRLEKKSRIVGDRPYPATAYLTTKILEYPDVPLVFDVDGAEAAARDISAFYSAPPILTDKAVDIYESGLNWFPSFRHRGRMNIGFVGGHVLSSSEPLAEPWWRWGYQPD